MVEPASNDSESVIAIAKMIWHRFANKFTAEWEDETHKAEYLDCAKEILAEAAERPKLKKRPVAFRIRNSAGNGWVLNENEEAAASYADAWGTDYQGLYVRDGT